MFGNMKNMSTFAVSSPKTMTLLLTKSGNFFIVCGLPCISNGATNPQHGLLDLSSDLSLVRRGEVALSVFILKQFSIMLKPKTSPKETSKTRLTTSSFQWVLSTSSEGSAQTKAETHTTTAFRQ